MQRAEHYSCPDKQADRNGESEYVIGSHGVLSSLFGHRVGGRRSLERTHELLRCSAIPVTNTLSYMIAARCLVGRFFRTSFRGIEILVLRDEIRRAPELPPE